MAKNTVKKESEFDHVVENPDALAERLYRSEDFVRKNRNVLIGAFAAVAVVIAGAFGYYQYKSSQNTEASAAMFQAVYYFEADSLNKALNGDGQYDGFIAIADEYGSTKTGNLAKFYAGTALLKQGKYQEALNYLEDFSSDDLLLQARAYSLIGDAQMELGNTAEAAAQYMKAANYKANEFFSPQYLMKAGMAYETQKNFAEAVATYDKIITNYPNTQEVNEAKKFKARAEEFVK